MLPLSISTYLSCLFSHPINYASWIFYLYFVSLFLFVLTLNYYVVYLAIWSTSITNSLGIDGLHWLFEWNSKQLNILSGKFNLQYIFLSPKISSLRISTLSNIFYFLLFIKNKFYSKVKIHSLHKNHKNKMWKTKKNIKKLIWIFSIKFLLHKWPTYACFIIISITR